MTTPARLVFALALASGCSHRALEVCIFEDASVPVDFAGDDFTPPPDLWEPDLHLPDLALADFTNRCPAGESFVMVVDEDNTLSRFRPDTLQFFDIMKLNCPAPPGSFPFSMAVGRDQTAWVVYNTGQLFKADSVTGICSATSYQPGQMGTTNFGMGFALDQIGSDNETLFVAAGNALGTGSTLGTISIPQLRLSLIAPVQGNPELTGTPDTNLWGYFPTLSPPIVAQIGKTNGGLTNIFRLPAVGSPQAWAFAAWGGDFWIFVWLNGAPSTDVFHLRPSDGSFTRAIQNTGRHIIGAGVSTCSDGLGG